MLYNDGKYEITLDHKKLKTPKGEILQVDSEPLALALATEWDSQRGSINISSMHLTSLVNTSIDNPNHLSKLDLVNHMLDYLPTDTVLFQSGEEDALYGVQTKEWDPLIQWFNERYSVDMAKNRDIQPVTVSSEIRMNIGKYLMSYNEPSLHAFVFAVDTLKSVMLSFACIDRLVTVEKAVLLSRLEEEFQSGYWGRVEWAHDSAQLELQARLAAAVLFIHFNSSSTLIKQKSIL